MKKYRAIDAIRGIFALLIVWHHLCPIMGIYYTMDLGNTIVLFFFVLSGFHITITWKDKIQGHCKDFIIKRCSKIFPIQWLTTLLCVVCGLNMVSIWAVPFHLTLTQSLIPFWEINFTINTPSWFLSSLFICYLFVPNILNFVNENRALFFVTLISCIICFTILVYVLPSTIGRRWLVYINPFARLMDFSIGILLGIIWSSVFHLVERVPKKNFFFTILEIVLVFSFVMVVSSKFMIALNNYPVIRYPFILLLISTFTWSYGIISKLFSNKVLSWLGSISMSIYMVHGFVLHYVSQLQEMPILGRVILTYLLVLFLSYLVNLALPYMASKFTVAANNIFNKLIY